MNKLAIILLSICMVFSVTSCTNVNDYSQGGIDSEVKNSKKDIETIRINIGETYDIFEGNKYYDDINIKWEVSEKSVADLRNSKFILGLNTGITDMKITYPEGVKKYHIEVEDANTNRAVYEDINNEDSDIIDGIGYGINVIQAEGASEEEIQKMKPILNVNKMIKDEKILYSEENAVEYTSINGETIREFVSNYCELYSASVGGGIGKLFSAGAKVSYEKSINKLENSNYSINKYSTLVKILKVFFRENSDNYCKYLCGEEADYENREIWKELIGTDEKHTSVEDFIKKYGTHIIVSGDFGGRADLNYVVSAKKSQSSEKSVKETTTTIKTFFTKTKTKKSIDEILKTAEVNNVSVDFYSKAEGGDTKRYSLDSLGNYNNNFEKWMDSISEQNSTLINFENASLYPIWNLLTDKYKDRKEEFKKYVEISIQKKYDESIIQRGR